MPNFDFYIMVDWSGAAYRKVQRADTIWIASGGCGDDEPVIVSPPSRTEAIQAIRLMLEQEVSQGHRTLLCFDFAYAFPRDFAAALQAASGELRNSPPWLLVWEYLRNHIQDDLGSSNTGKPSNSSNRFEIASHINSLLSLSGDGRRHRLSDGRQLWISTRISPVVRPKPPAG
jgi:hypothetical protein